MPQGQKLQNSKNTTTKVETIVNKFKNIIKGKKRKNNEVNLSPSHKAYQKSPKRDQKTSMAAKMEKLEQRQEDMVKENKESTAKLTGMMESH